VLIALGAPRRALSPSSAQPFFLPKPLDRFELQERLSVLRTRQMPLDRTRPYVHPQACLGDLDATVGRAAAEWTAQFVTRPSRFGTLAGVGHFITDLVPERLTRLLLDHVGTTQLPT
jgi:hypothetical protein